MTRRTGPQGAESTAPYYTIMRENERRLLRSALEEFKTVPAAAMAIGISGVYFGNRAIYLGGVFEGQPPREPPGRVTDTRKNVRAEKIPPRKPGPGENKNSLWRSMSDARDSSLKHESRNNGSGSSSTSNDKDPIEPSDL
jgi:hypothetical protein